MSFTTSAEDGPPRWRMLLRGNRYLWLLLLLAGVLLLARLGSKCLWGDEVATLYFSSTPARTLQDLRHPPLYYALLYAWMQIVGLGEARARVLSALCGVAVVALGIAAGRSAGSVGVAWRAGLLLATSPLLLLYARMLRAYALTTALALGATLCLALALQKPTSRRYWVIYALTLLALLYTDYTTTASIFAAHVLVLLVLAHSRSAESRQIRRRWLYAMAGVVIGALPLFFYLFLGPQPGKQTGGLPADLAQSPLGMGMKLAYPLVTFATGETIGLWRWWWIIPICVLYAFLILKALRLRDPLANAPKAQLAERSVVLYAAALAAMLLINAGLLSFSRLATHIPVLHSSRLALAGLPFFLILAAVGLNSLSRPLWRGGILAALLITNGFGVSNYFAGREFHNPNWDLPWRDMAKWVRSRTQPGEMVITFEHPFLYYYYGGDQSLGEFLQAWSQWRSNTPTRLASVLVLGMPRRPRPEQLQAYLQSPGIWLIRRDRGATTERLSAETARGLLAANYARVEEKGFAPVDPAAARLRSAVLSRAAWPSAVFVDHYTVPRSKAAPTKASLP